jgi:hypothetical protein
MAVTLPSVYSAIGQPVSSPSELAPPSPLLADNIDPDTGDFASLETGMDPIDAQVVFALSVRRNSGPAVLGVGNDLHTLGKMGESGQQQIKGVVQLALHRLIDNEDIEYLGTEFDLWDESNQTAYIRVGWKNLRTYNAQVRSLTLETS